MIIKVNNNEVKVTTGFSLNLTLDESLDTGTILIPFSTQKDAYKRWDDVEITEGGTTYDMVVGMVSEKLISKDPLIYENSLQLIELTKKLERITISAASFTQPGELSSREPYTLKDVAELLIRKAFFNKAPIIYPYSLDIDTETYLDTFIAPEFQFNNVTLRQALDEVFEIAGGVCRLVKVGSSQQIKIERFNELKDKLENIKILNENSVKHINNYGSVAVSNISNAYSVTNNIIYPSRDFFALPTDSVKDGILDTASLIFEVLYPIRSINKVEMFFTVAYRDGGVLGASTRIFDVTDFIYDYEKWFNLLPKDPTSDDYEIDNYIINKSNTIYFKRKNNAIEGLSNSVRLKNILSTDTTILKRLMETVGAKWARDNGYTFESVTTEEKECLIKLDYNGYIVNNSIKLERDTYDNQYKNNEIFINQNAKRVDLLKSGKTVQTKINRLGLQETSYEVTHDVLDSVYNVGDYSEQGIITQVTLIIEEDHIIANYATSKDFNKINEFIGVNKEYRAYDILAADSSRLRWCNYTDYAMITTTGSAVSNTSILTTAGIDKFSKTFGTNTQPLNNILFKRFEEGTATEVEAILVNPQDCPYGDSVVISFAFNNPFVAGYRVDVSEGITIPFYYADETEGVLTQFWIEGVGQLLGGGNSLQEKAENLPEFKGTVAETYIDNSSNLFLLYKDPSEILGFNYIIKMQRDSADIVVGDALARNCGLITETDGSLKIYLSTETYNQSEKYRVKGSEAASSTITLTPTAGGFKLDVPAVLGTYNSFAIGDADENLLLAVNRVDGVLNETVYFNFTDTNSNLINL